MKKIVLIIFLCVLGACTKKETVEPQKVYYSVNDIPDSAQVEWVKDLGGKYRIHFLSSQSQYFNVKDVETHINDSMSYDGKIKLYFKNDTMYLHYKGNINKLK
jgi:hypothetical protein